MIKQYKVYFSDGYFCCSTLPLLNGDIKRIIERYYIETIGTKELEKARRQARESEHLDVVFKKVITLLEKELKNPYMNKLRALKIKQEYKRMLKLYKYRLNMLERCYI